MLGDHSITKFAQVPEFDLKASSRLTNWLTVSAGFSTLYWNRRFVRFPAAGQRAPESGACPSRPVVPSIRPLAPGRQCRTRNPLVIHGAESGLMAVTEEARRTIRFAPPGRGKCSPDRFPSAAPRSAA